jgi:hypothetical protein
MEGRGNGEPRRWRGGGFSREQREVSRWRSRAAARLEMQGVGAARLEEGDDPEGGLGRSGLCRPIASWAGVAEWAEGLGQNH